MVLFLELLKLAVTELLDGFLVHVLYFLFHVKNGCLDVDGVGKWKIVGEFAVLFGFLNLGLYDE